MSKDKNKEKIIKILVQKGENFFNQPYVKINFAKNFEADELLNNLKEYPHAFVLACVMDRQMKAEKAWLIPYKVSQEIGGFGFKKLILLKLKDIKDIFKRKNLHRFNEIMADCFYWTIQKIHRDYNDDASNIWKDKPSSASITRRFLEFKGVGIKIASMSANILAREFKIPMKDYLCIDISPDVHAKRVFIRVGLISKNTNNEELIYCARELNPDYPGIFDLSVWKIGKNWCHARKPECKKCYLNKYCPKIL